MTASLVLISSGVPRPILRPKSNMIETLEHAEARGATPLAKISGYAPRLDHNNISDQSTLDYQPASSYPVAPAGNLPPTTDHTLPPQDNQR